MNPPETNMVITDTDMEFMSIALEEAGKGIGRTSPNPCVGAVVVRDGLEISRGYHQKAGTPHAEIHALNGAGRKAKGATMYVTLEPCNHTGRTPPCSHAVVQAGISKIVIGMTDPNPLVSGSGIEYLRENNVEVLSGVLEEECRELNRPFLKHITSGVPYVILKAGMSLDGRLSYQEGVPGKMTGPESLIRSHKLRDSVDAILIGIGTQLADNPSLTTRLGDSGKDPLRIVLDSSLRIPSDAKILHLDSDAPTLIICSDTANIKKIEHLSKMDNVQVKVVDNDQSGRINLNLLLHFLGNQDICSLLVEGGSKIHSSFLKQGLVDRVMLFVAPLFAGSAGNSLFENVTVTERKTAPMLGNVRYIPCGDDLLVQGDLG